MSATRLFIAALGATLLAAPAATAGAQRDRDRDRDRDDSRNGDVRDSQRWNWSGTITEGRWLYVRNLNGAIRVEPSRSGQVEIEATKRAGRRGNVDDVKITVEQRSGHGDAVVCAIWNDRTRCDEDGYRTNSSRGWFDSDDRRGNDVSVEFVVRLPRGVRVTASTVNGGLEIDGVDAEVDAHTVNGDVVARSNGGPVRAGTTNGSLTVRTGQIGRETLDYSTVNGAITVEIPDNASADVEMHTVNGGISSDFPLTIEGRFNNRRVRGTIGRGGPLLRLSTTNGSIRLRRA
ncbi:MAG TPA: DUF4097 family beta strand repeat-containing protein [Gemmatimonadaceae bacterium]|nr:DUF4097 family beta strand repeat-containing protein [Gemmatimonadaceae bacterium]